MRASVLSSSVFALALSVSMTQAFAADVAAVSKIDAVTVFPAGAEITRLAKVRLQAGEHTIVLTDLPATAIGQSIRVEGKSTGTLSIGSVDTRQTLVTRGEQEVTAAERRQIENEIEKLSDEKAVLLASVEAAQAQKKLISRLADLPGQPVLIGAQPPQQPDWSKLSQLIGEQTIAAQKLILDTQVKVRDVDRKVVDLQKRLAPIAAAQEARTEVKIAVTAGTVLEADLTVRYQVSNAAWTPFYDARLVTGNRTAAPKLSLVRRAGIQQRTGEAWENVALSLSTTRPSQGSQAPELQPMLVDIFDPRPVGRAMDSVAVGVAAPAPPPAGAAPMAAMKTRAAPAMEAVAQVSATIEGNAFQAIYGIAGRSSVLQSGEVKRVQIDATDIDPTLTVRTVPKLDPKAFLYAKLQTPKTTAILAGAVSLFRDGTFVGSGRLPQLAPGEDHELGFGQDDNVRVKYAVTDEKRSESGILTTSKTDAKTFKITVKSLHERPIAVRVIDQMPVSTNQEVKIETTAKVPPTGRDPEDKRGLVYWDFNMAPDEERVLDFGHRITWPAAKQLSVR
jgi:uncharacterized protein (TIGR02231 family)